MLIVFASRRYRPLLTDNCQNRHNRDKDSSYIIKILYARGKDLRQLKHLFESYEKLFKGIMGLGTETGGGGGDDRDSMGASSANVNGTPARGVKLSQKAYDRFARLNDRLKLLMLDTIDEYLEEKSSLSSTYFNLLALKDSQATSKLNRSASLLAKLSVFFLPISFMTSYFSVEIPDLVCPSPPPPRGRWMCLVQKNRKAITPPT